MRTVEEVRWVALPGAGVVVRSGSSQVGTSLLHLGKPGGKPGGKTGGALGNQVEQLLQTGKDIFSNCGGFNCCASFELALRYRMKKKPIFLFFFQADVGIILISTAEARLCPQRFYCVDLVPDMAF